MRLRNVVPNFVHAWSSLMPQREQATSELPERYLRLAREQYRRDLELNAAYDEMYARLYSTDALEKRPFINFGPGSFWHKYWQTADRTYDGQTWSELRGNGYEMRIDIAWNLLEGARVDCPDNSIHLCYSSHVVEHAWDADVAAFFAEVYRILRRGGVFRVTCPDASLGVRAWRRGDADYYMRHRGKPPAYGLLNDCSLVTHPDNGFRVRPHTADAFLSGFPTVFEALDRASELSDRQLQHRVGAHVNWFSGKKLTRLLEQAGFKRIYESRYGQSISPVLRDTRYFDKTDPHMTCYIDALKV